MKRRRLFRLSRAAPAATVLVAAVLASTSPAHAADWPTYRGDSGRTGYSAEELPQKLTLRWCYRAAHPPRPAWPDPGWEPQRMAFDRVYQPVVADGLLYFGSSADDTVYALDAAAGEERWRYVTDGPVRFAPVVWKDKVLVCSDDGYLYCLDAKKGTLLWKKRGGVDDRKVLGNGRMISLWCARGGPAVRDGVVYFGSGIFPSQGFFLHALDAETGKPAWINDTAGSQYIYTHPGGVCFTGVGAQGYLAATEDTIIVPTGRADPAVFRRSDGDLVHFRPEPGIFRGGGSWVMAFDKHYMNMSQVYHLKTGRIFCPEAGNSLQKPGKGTGEAALAPERLYLANGKEIVAVDRAKLLGEHSCRGRPRLGYLNPKDYKALNAVWSAPIPCEGALIVAGERLYAGSRGLVSALDVTSKRIVWSTEVEGGVYGLAAAAGRLYASTDRGLIYCFGEAESGQPSVQEQKIIAAPYKDERKVHAAVAQEIIKTTGVTEGYCLDIGCGDGRLSYELARRTKLQIVAIEQDEKDRAAARQALSAAGLYGARVHVLPSEPKDLPDYFANLVVSGRSVAGDMKAASSEEVHRIQRPHGGVACFGKPGALRTTVRGPLEGAGEWTHTHADTGNTSSSMDRHVKAPLGVLWFGGPSSEGMPNVWQRPPVPLVVHGRVYTEGKDFIRCTDAYNGSVMWEKRIRSIGDAYVGPKTFKLGTMILGNNYCATSDSLYVHDGARCYRLDGRTGKELGVFKPPAGKDGRPGRWGFIACVDDVLFGTLEGEPHELRYFVSLDMNRRLEKPTGRLTKQITQAETFFAVNSTNGGIRWSYEAENQIRKTAIAIGRGRVFLIDRPRSKPPQSNLPAEHPSGKLIALDAATGKVVWRNEEDIFGTVLMLSEEHDALVVCRAPTYGGALATDHGNRLAVFRASAGKRLWDRGTPDIKKPLYTLRPVLVGRTIIGQPRAWDLLTGEPKTRTNPVTGKREPWVYGQARRCGLASASEHLLLYRTSALTYYDLADDTGVGNFGGLRLSCYINAIPAGGLVIVPDNYSGCTCNLLHRTSMALHPTRQNEYWTSHKSPPLEAGIIHHLAINLGAPGDRRAPDGTLWLRPWRPTRAIRQRTRPVNVPVLTDAILEIKGGEPYRRHADAVTVAGTDKPWIYTSGLRGPVRLTFNVNKMPAGTGYRVRLHFAELEDVRPGERVFQVSIGDRAVLEDFDIIKEAGKRYAPLVKEFTVRAGGSIQVQLVPVSEDSMPTLSGVEIEAGGK